MMNFDERTNWVSDKKSNFFKWSAIGCLGTVFIFSCLIGFLVWRFTPLIEFDQESGKMQLFGGTVSLEDFKGNFFYSSTNIKEEIDLRALSNKKISIIGPNIMLQLRNSSSDFIVYNCQVSGDHIISREDGFTLHFHDSLGAQCEVEVPKNYSLFIETKNAKVSAWKLENPINLEADNAQVEFEPKEEMEYNYNLSIGNGKIGDFQNSNSDRAFKIKAKIENGNFMRFQK